MIEIPCKQFISQTIKVICISEIKIFELYSACRVFYIHCQWGLEQHPIIKIHYFMENILIVSISVINKVC